MQRLRTPQYLGRKQPIGMVVVRNNPTYTGSGIGGVGGVGNWFRLRLGLGFLNGGSSGGGSSAQPPFGGVGTLSAPTLGTPSPIASNPTTISITIPVDWQSGDILKLAYSVDEGFRNYTVLPYTLSDSDVAAGTIHIGIPTLSSITFLEALGNHGGNDSANISNKVCWGDTVAPVIGTNAAQNAIELTPMAIALTADKTVAWTITGGADQTQFEISGSTLRWYNNGTQDNSAPADVDQNKTYIVQVTATSLAGVATNKTITVTSTDADKTCDAFDLGADLAPATPNTDNDSPNAVGTITGVTAGINIPFTITNGTIQKNGGSFVSSGTVQLGDSLGKLRVHSGSGGTDIVIGTVTIGSGGSAVSDTWTVSNSAVTTTLTTATGTSKHTNVTISGSPANHFLANSGVGARQFDRATAGKSGSKRVVEFTITAAPSVNQWLAFGIDDNSINMNGSGLAPAIDGGGGNGAAIIMQPTVVGWGWIDYYNSASINSNTNYVAQVGDTLTMVIDQTGGAGTHSIAFYHTRSGVTNLIDTLSSRTFPATYYAFIGCSSNALAGDMNFGATAFVRTLGGGEVAYG